MSTCTAVLPGGRCVDCSWPKTGLMYCFGLISPQRKLFLIADSIGELGSWLRVLRNLLSPEIPVTNPREVDASFKAQAPLPDIPTTIKRITLLRNGGDHEGRVVPAPQDMIACLALASAVLGIKAARLFTDCGGEITDFSLVRDDDVIYASEGEPFSADGAASRLLRAAMQLAESATLSGGARVKDRESRHRQQRASDSENCGSCDEGDNVLQPLSPFNPKQQQCNDGEYASSAEARSLAMARQGQRWRGGQETEREDGMQFQDEMYHEHTPFRPGYEDDAEAKYLELGNREEGLGHDADEGVDYFQVGDLGLPRRMRGALNENDVSNGYMSVGRIHAPPDACRAPFSDLDDVGLYVDVMTTYSPKRAPMRLNTAPADLPGDPAVGSSILPPSSSAYDLVVQQSVTPSMSTSENVESSAAPAPSTLSSEALPNESCSSTIADAVTDPSVIAAVDDEDDNSNALPTRPPKPARFGGKHDGTDTYAVPVRNPERGGGVGGSGSGQPYVGMTGRFVKELSLKDDQCISIERAGATADDVALGEDDLQSGYMEPALERPAHERPAHESKQEGPGYVEISSKRTRQRGKGSLYFSVGESVPTRSSDYLQLGRTTASADYMALRGATEQFSENEDEKDDDEDEEKEENGMQGSKSEVVQVAITTPPQIPGPPQRKLSSRVQF